MIDPARVLDAVAYGDAFDTAVTLDEVWKYAREAMPRDELRALLTSDAFARAVVVRDGHVAARARAHLIDGRAPGISHARAIERRACRIGRMLAHVPFVRGVALTGSAAAGNAPPDADTDLLLVVSPGRLATVFVLLGSAARLLGRSVLCPNYYLAADALLFAPSAYVARELAQAVPLAGEADLVAANPWLRDWFPNLPPSRRIEPMRRWAPTRAVETLLGGRVGDALERRARRIAVARLRAHHGSVGEQVPSEVLAALAVGRELRFHRSGVRPGSEQRYERALDALVAAVSSGGRVGPHG